MSSRRARGRRPPLAWVLLAAVAVAPTGTLVPVAARADTIQLSWTAPGDDDALGRAAMYDLRYSESPVGSDTTSWWSGATLAGSLPIPATAGTRETFAVTGLNAGTTYYFVIRTADEVPNWSGYSNVSARQTGPPPADSLATPTGFTASLVSGGARLRWDPVASGSGSGFRLYRGVAGSVGSLRATFAPSDTAWTDTTVVGGAAYEYRLTVYDGTGEGQPALALISIPGDRLLAETALHGFPNPARDHVTLRYHVSTPDGSPGRLRVTVFDLSGRKICALLDAPVPPGEQALEWNCRSDGGNRVAPGLYNVILDGPSGRHVTRLAVLP